MTLSNVFSAAKPVAVATYLPGVVLVAVITASAYGLRHLPFLSSLSPMISAIFVGMLFANVVGFAATANAGISVAGKRLLRLAVALLGLQLTFGQLVDIGPAGLVFAATVVVSTMLFTVWVGRLLGVEPRLTVLLAAGTAICGASAIAGANAVTRARDEDVSYSVACITLFGTIAMLIYPVLRGVLDLDPRSYGFWTGLSVHEVAQVVGAGFQGGEIAGQTAVVTKLVRVMMLAPVVVSLAFIAAKRDGSARQGSTRMPPFFIIGFVLLVLLNSAGTLPSAIQAPIVSMTPVFLTASMAALGLGTKFSSLKERGFRPLLLAAVAAAFIAAEGFIMATALS